MVLRNLLASRAELGSEERFGGFSGISHILHPKGPDVAKVGTSSAESSVCHPGGGTRRAFRRPSAVFGSMVLAAASLEVMARRSDRNEQRSSRQGHQSPHHRARSGRVHERFEILHFFGGFAPFGFGYGFGFGSPHFWSQLLLFQLFRLQLLRLRLRPFPDIAPFRLQQLRVEQLRVQQLRLRLLRPVFLFFSFALQHEPPARAAALFDERLGFRGDRLLG